MSSFVYVFAMALREYLLAERERVQKELNAVEELLRTRCGWSSPKDSTVTASVEASPTTYDKVIAQLPDTSKPVSATAASIFSDDGIPYMEEANSFIAQLERDQFGQADFRNYLIERYGEEKINEQSVRGPLPKLVKKGVIKVIRASIGKRPVIYGVDRTEPSPQADEDLNELL